MSDLIKNTCSNNCFGHAGNHGGCCTMANRNYIIGPILDHLQFLFRLNSTTGKNYKWKDVFIDYEEGRKMFPDRSHWQEKQNFPALRVDMDNTSLPCNFYDLAKRECSVYNIRPTTCKKFFCSFLQETLTEEEKSV